MTLLQKVITLLTLLLGWVRGESTASAMENQLSDLERKIDDLLASVEDTANDTDDVAHVTGGEGKSKEGRKENKQ